MINWSRAMLAPVAVAAAIGLAACGSGSAPASGSAQPSPDMSNMEGHDMSNMEGAQGGHGGHGGSGELELWAVQTGPLGTVVTDGSGQVIYRSDRDGNAPSKSNCTADCTAMWQPLIADLSKPPELLGVDENKVGLVARDDGTEQLTLAGWPLYRHVGAHADLGDTGANGADGVWFAIAPDGAKAAPAAAPVSMPPAAPAPAPIPGG